MKKAKKPAKKKIVNRISKKRAAKKPVARPRAPKPPVGTLTPDPVEALTPGLTY